MPETTTPIGSVFGVFGEVTDWFATTLPRLTDLFYADGEITIIGTMLVASLGVGVTLLLFNKVRNIFRFR